jgi:predicted N-acetyltransferase YhbS
MGDAARERIMKLRLRPGAVADAKEWGRIQYEAFKSIAAQHNFPSDFPSVEVATDVVTMLVSHPRFYSVVAELDGRIVGGNFLDERSTIAGIGPVSVDPPVMNGTIGRQLMRAVMDRAAEHGFPGVRLLQIAWHYRSLALYAKLGFDVREAVTGLQGAPLHLAIPGHDVRPARAADVAACNQLCFHIHGHDRVGELTDAVRDGTANVVERLGRITGYSTAIGWFHHAVGETNDDLKALIGAAPSFLGPGFLLPSRNGELFRWCLANNLRVVAQSTLMTIGLYNEPSGAFLPSILY